MTEVILEGRKLRYRFGADEALRGVDIAISQGEVVAVMGPSGSGKSTLLHLLAGLLRPASGEVWLAGRRFDTLPDRRRSALRLTQMGFVFQFGDLIPELTVVENVELPLLLTDVGRSQARGRALDMLDSLGIRSQASRRLSQVSGGEAQRAAVARALVHQPPVLLADEPTGALDTVTGELVLEAMIRASREQGAAVMIVTHELKVASWASRDILLRDGRVVGASDDADPSPAALPAVAAAGVRGARAAGGPVAGSGVGWAGGSAVGGPAIPAGGAAGVRAAGAAGVRAAGAAGVRAAGAATPPARPGDAAGAATPPARPGDAAGAATPPARPGDAAGPARAIASEA
ncbi:MAG: ATP-binding cassette domain-containing protein [Bifidobacteriaceae bacterium]|jgi:putative ABC transport system ATP-binding protein|nr:ATP-binding cassette domain-containing protein [Bifidobacteriaceae bacterium]